MSYDYIHVGNVANQKYIYGAKNVIDIRDVAHSLSQTNRFAGHTLFPYSVGQHSLLAGHLAKPYTTNPTMLLRVLLHDAHEMCMGDIPTPCSDYMAKKILAHTGVAYDVVRDVKAEIDLDVWASFGFKTPMTEHEHKLLKWCDFTSFVTEAEQILLDHRPEWLHPDWKAAADIIYPMTAKEVEDAFLCEYRRLQDARETVGSGASYDKEPIQCLPT